MNVWGWGSYTSFLRCVYFVVPFVFLSFVIYGSNRFFFFLPSVSLWSCVRLGSDGLLWCYHMIFHLASSVWLAWLQSLRNSCSLLTTRFFILFFSPQFSILPFSFGVFFFFGLFVSLFWFYIFIYFLNEKMEPQWTNGKDEEDLG